MMLSVHDLNRAAEWLIPLLWQATWQGGLALLLVAIVCRVVKSIPARVQCWMWRLALLKLLVAGFSLAAWELPWLPPQAMVQSNTKETMAVNVAPPARVTDAVPFTPPAATGKTTTAAVPVVVPPTAPVSRVQPNPTVSASRTASLTPWGWLLIAWCGGVLLSTLKLLREWRRVRELVASAKAVECKIVQQRLATHCRRLRLSRPPRLCQSHHTCNPCLVGLFRPRIIVPAELLESEQAATLDAVLLHELAHVRRRDLLWNWLPAVVDVLFFFHPVHWWAKREWRVAQEIATDQLAISSAKIDVASYAQSLVALVATGQPAKPVHLTVGVTETFSQLERRILAMKTSSKMNRTRITMTAVLLAVTVLGVLPWKLTAQERGGPVKEYIQSAQRNLSMDNMKEIVLAIHRYHDAIGHFPPAATYDKGRKPLLSWRVHLLPMLKQQSLYEQFHLDEPWDSAHNKKLVEKMPTVFASPGTKPESGQTRYLAVVGNETAFPVTHKAHFRSITDGLSNTIAFVEAIHNEAVPWTKPGDLEFSDTQLLKKIVNPRAKSFLATFADGHVSEISSRTSLEALRALLGRADGHVSTFSADGEVTYKKIPKPTRAGSYGGRGGYGGEMGGYGEYGGYSGEMGGYGGEMGGYGRAMGQGGQRADGLELVLTTKGTVEILGKQVPIKKLGPILAAIKAAGDSNAQSGENSTGHATIKLPRVTDYQPLRELTQLCEEYGFEEIRILSEGKPQ